LDSNIELMKWRVCEPGIFGVHAGERSATRICEAVWLELARLSVGMGRKVVQLRESIMRALWHVFSWFLFIFLWLNAVRQAAQYCWCSEIKSTVQVASS
jgi:hypothetical protein